MIEHKEMQLEPDRTNKGLSPVLVDAFMTANRETPFIVPAIQLRIGRATLHSLISAESSWSDILQGPSTHQKQEMIQGIQRMHHAFGVHAVPTEDQIDIHWEMGTEHLWETCMLMVKDSQEETSQQTSPLYQPPQNEQNAEYLKDHFSQTANASTLLMLYDTAVDALDTARQAAQQWRNLVTTFHTHKDLSAACKEIFQQVEPNIDTTRIALAREQGIIVPQQVVDKFKLQSFGNILNSLSI